MRYVKHICLAIRCDEDNVTAAWIHGLRKPGIDANMSDAKPQLAFSDIFNRRYRLRRHVCNNVAARRGVNHRFRGPSGREVAAQDQVAPAIQRRYFLGLSLSIRKAFKKGCRTQC